MKLGTRAVVAGVLALCALAAAQDRAADWNRVREALTKGLPKTALESMDAIITSAEDTRDYGEAVRAITLKIALEAGIQGNKSEEKITRLQIAIARAPAEMRPAMEAILADWYWQYFRANRWRFMDRTRTAAAPDSDFTTWDLPRLFAEIDRHFTLALAGAPSLQRESIALYSDLFVGGTAPDSYRPTLYDAVAFEALGFYASGEQAGAQPEDAFVLQAESPAFAEAGDFVRWSIATTDTGSRIVKGLRLYQQLLRFHAGDADPSARIDADLWRIAFVHDQAVGATRDARYAAALERLIDRDGAHEISARALSALASLRRGQGDLPEAHRLAQRGFARFPNSVGGRRCANVIADIEAKELRVSVSERVWNVPRATIDVDYRNLDAVWFRLVPFDFENEILRPGRRDVEWLTPDEMHAVLERKPAHEWWAPVPATSDFKHRHATLRAPGGLPPGSYYLVSSARSDFSETNNSVALAVVWVTDLEFVFREGRPSGLEGFVLDALTGAPVVGAEVRSWLAKPNGAGNEPGPAARTDTNGLFRFSEAARIDALMATLGSRRFAHSGRYPNFVPYPQHALERTEFFTDRALYRPGQTVRYKALCIRTDSERDDYATMPACSVEVVVSDPNGREIARSTHFTNSYGSFSDTLVAPSDGVLGRMTIEVERGPDGRTNFDVEEYKRPRFFTTLAAPAVAPKLAGPVEVVGHAIGYDGAPAGGATVAWRIVRGVRLPDWWSWWYGWHPEPGAGTREIAHGTAVTDADGRFTIGFGAIPDSSVAADQEPVFRFSVFADVTDATGETRSATRIVNVGYTALSASVAADDWQEAARPVALTVRTTTLDGEPQAASGTLAVLRLREPERVTREALPGAKVDIANPDSWPEGAVVSARPFRTDTTGVARISLTLGAGFYRVRLETRDRFGRRVIAMQRLRVVDPAAARCPVRVADLFAVRAATVEAGDEFLAVWGTGYENAFAFVEVECRGRMLQSFWVGPGRTQAAIRQHVDESMRGGFTVRVTRICENRAYLHEQYVGVPWSDRVLDLRWEHFVSKLSPGACETWTAVVRGPHASMAAAEMVATLYDASLDAFAPFHWPGLWGFRTNRDLRGSYFTVGPSALRPMIETWRGGWRDESLQYRAIPAGLLWGNYTYGLLDNVLPGQPAVTHSPATVGTGKLGGLSGDLFDETGAPVPYSNVRISPQKLGALTDEHGHFEIRGIAPGQVTVHVAAIGYEPVDFTENIASGLIAHVTVRLGHSTSVKQMEEIEIRGDRRVDTRSSTTKQSITPGTLRDLPVDNLGEAIGLKAGVAAGGNELHFRGGRAGEARFSMDGASIETDEAPDLSTVESRTDLRETAFFFPHLLADANGEVRMEFTAPQALTTWRFLGFAHDDQLRSGALAGSAVTAKDLMVLPNPPRFLREGDELEFTVKVTNRTDSLARGRVRLTFRDAGDSASVDAALANLEPERGFAVPARDSRTYAWRVRVPDDLGAIAYTAVAATARYSDGEDGALPVLSRRTLVIESLPLPIRGPAVKSFDFERLRRAGESGTLRSQSLTVQMVSNPAWYAVLALPYLIEYPFECSEQTFNRLYANELARHIASSDPRIREVFDRWRDTPALDSPLEKNEALKSVTIAETPWRRQAKAESQARRNVGVLFDGARLDAECRHVMDKLARMQLPDGSWPWFPGGYGDRYLTLYIATGFARLRHLGVDVSMEPALHALTPLDEWSDQTYREILAHGRPDQNNLTPMVAFYLYGRSFFLADKPIGPRYREATDYWLGQARRYWLQLDDRQSKAHLALALMRFGDRPAAKAILRSVREYAVTSEELGMFWRDTEYSWWWYRAPIETQATMIEAFDEVMKDSVAVEECKVWLLKQKQTQDWKTTKATADAVYALLLRGTGVLASQALVSVVLGDSTIRAAGVEAGTGFYEQRFSGKDVVPAMGRVTVRKSDRGVAWGSVHWQYLEDMDKVTPYAGTPLRLAKSIFVRATGKSGPELRAIAGAVHVGDELVVRVELRTDRDMEYVHLEDYRGSGVEPTHVLSSYKYQDGLRYYEETRDVASHFFIDYLPKGTYVFEYPVRVQHRGRYTSGVAQIQCLYAPEFNSHSGSVPLVVE